MNLGDLIVAEATLSDNNSRLAYQAIISEQNNWRCYSPMVSSGGREEVDKLCERYLRSHATVPSAFSKEVLSPTPMEIFECTWGEFFLHGGLYVNGAVVHVKHPLLNEGDPYNLLFIDDALAARWGYPDDYKLPSHA